MNCPNGCGDTLREIKRDQLLPHPEGGFCIIRDLEVLQCEECGEIVIPAASSREIDRILKDDSSVDEYTEVPTYRAQSA